MNFVTYLWEHGRPDVRFLPNGAVSASVSKTDLFSQIGEMVEVLRLEGVKRGSRIVLVCGNSVLGLATLLATIASAAIAIPIKPGKSHVDILKLAAEVQADYLIRLERRGMGEAVTGSAPREMYLLEALKARQSVACEKGGATSWIEAIDGDVDTTIALETLSSGTTGKAKVIARTHAELSAFALRNHQLFAPYLQLGSSMPKCILSTLPLAHLSGFGYSVEGILAGVDVLLLDHFDATLVLKLINDSQLAWLILLPSMYGALITEIGRSPQSAPKALKACVYAGEACNGSVQVEIEDCLGAPALSAYGLSECLVGIGHDLDALSHGSVAAGSCGRHMFGQIRLVDENGVDSPAVGELLVRNETVPAALRTASGFRMQGEWLCTGDILRRDEEGNFFYVGRCDDRFVVHGTNIYPIEIEQVASALPGVSAVCVAPIVNRLGQNVVAMMVVADWSGSAGFDRAALMVPSTSMPAFVMRCDALPRLESGKVHRREVTRCLQEEYRKKFAGRVVTTATGDDDGS